MTHNDMNKVIAGDEECKHPYDMNRVVLVYNNGNDERSHVIVICSLCGEVLKKFK